MLIYIYQNSEEIKTDKKIERTPFETTENFRFTRRHHIKEPKMNSLKN